MTNRHHNNEQDWSEIRSQWVESDRQLRAPDTLLDPVFRKLNRRESRARTAGYIAAAAAALIAAVVWWDARIPDRGTTSVVEATPVHLPAAAEAREPCASAQSCVDVRTRLALLSVGVVPDL